jgi:hypothetical protein
MRTAESGATRNLTGDKLAYSGFLSPLVLKRYAQYMHSHRTQADGTVRSPANWQRGMPLDWFEDSGWRHFMDWWLHHRGFPEEASEPVEEALCALMFNISGYLHELLVAKRGSRPPVVE